MSKKLSVLFVCLGNICRSPLAQGVFENLLVERDLSDSFAVDSCGTGAWHVGNKPDSRMRETAKRHGISLEGQRARQVRASDFDEFDFIVAMDLSNLRDLKRVGEKASDQLFCLREYDTFSNGDLDVPDPYYGGADGFEEVYEIVSRSCECLLDRLAEDL